MARAVTTVGWVLVALAACSADREDPRIPGRVETQSGAVRGVRSGESWAYLGIPYAAPPVGELRWRAPEAPAAWEEELEASAFGASCVQQAIPLAGQEDCLTLNVWAPADADLEEPPLPVLVFLHAGDNNSGSSSDEWLGARVYDGAWLAARARAVVVTPNYRVGALGFLAHPALAVAAGAAGNYGLLDQIAALRWVHDNAAAFGGDPGRVTLAGLSAGAVDTCMLYVSPQARDLIHGAIMHSGACETLAPGHAASTATEAAEVLGCAGAGDVAACLRGADVAAIAALPTDTATSDYNPVVDGVVLPSEPEALLAAGQHAAAPVLFGTTVDEYSMLVDWVVPGPIETEEAYRATIHELIGNPEGGDLVLGQYPTSEYPTFRDGLIALFTDVLFDCPNRRAARALTAAGIAPGRRYLFRHTFADAELAYYRAAHGFDVLFLFNAVAALEAPTDDELAFAGDVADSWAAFLHTGEPGPLRGVAWPAYEAASDPRLAVDLEPGTVSDPRRRQCDFWDAALP